MSTNWTSEDLAAIEEAIACGALEVEYNDRRVRYRSMKDLLTARELIRRCLGLTKKTGSRLLCESKKGTC